jgi:tryptophanyl-tRNA synthetase
MQPFTEVLESIPDANWLMRRGIIFGHRDYEKIVEAMLSRKPWAVMSGFMPSGLPHFGHKMTMDEIVWHQKMGGATFVAIADMEARAVRNLSWKTIREMGIEYIKSIIALGLDENAIIYFQSASKDVRHLAFELTTEVNWSELKAIYGFTSETTLAKMFITSIQAADILHPQLKEFGGPKPTVIPVGTDQDPHIRLTRDLASRISIFSMEPIDGGLRIRSRRGREYLKKLSPKTGFEQKIYEEHIDIFGDRKEIEDTIREVELELGGFAFIPPSSTYHCFITGLTGGKMSSSKPESYISLLDEPREAGKKVMKGITGGKGSAEEQRRFGGEPEKCSIFELYAIHLVADDKELEEIRSECKGGRLLCGHCKQRAAELVENFLKEVQEKMDEAGTRLDEYNIIVR